jgi:hypothetical protein
MSNLTVDPVIVELIAKAKDSPQIVAVVAQIDEHLLKTHWAWRQHIHPKKVGIHESNRGGYGVGSQEFLQLGSDVTMIGFVPSACADACCFQDGDEHASAVCTKSLCDADPDFAKFE